MIKLYTLYQDGSKITALSQCCYHGVPILMVAAVSIKQAYYLAYNHIWFDGQTGILEVATGDVVRDWEGNRKLDLRFKPGRARPLPKSFLGSKT